jgi:hypothetical protein
MNCQEFWNTLPDLDAGHTDDGHTDAGHPHTGECAACAGRMARQRELSRGLRSLAAGLREVQAPARVETRLISAFRSHAGLSEPVAVRRRWVPALTWAAALAAMLAVGVLVVRQREPEAKQKPAPSHTIELAMLEPASTAMQTAADEGFLILPGAAQLAPAEDLNLVHVELPRSAMMQVGYEVSPERADETVRADVMMGADGMARAVRFLEVSGSD